jgi:adenine phosphoribosyltransferase
MDLDPFLHPIPDWPKPGVTFLDITPLLGDAQAFAAAVAALAAPAGDEPPAAVAGIEARGFILGAAVAHHLGVGFVPIRKHGKLPRATYAESYALEYGEAVLEIHRDAFPVGGRILVVDDVLATGGTLAAACRLVELAGGSVAAAAVLIEIAALDGRALVPDRPVVSVLVR